MEGPFGGAGSLTYFTINQQSDVKPAPRSTRLPDPEPRAYASVGPWTSFIVAVQFLLLFPLLPLATELAFTREITVASLTLVTATYATSLAMSSRSLFNWALGLMTGLVFSSVFGWSMALTRPAPAYRVGEGTMAGGLALWVPAIVLAGMFTLHLWERHERHVERGEVFPEFLKP
jgi:hypothetical protein